MDTNQHIPPLGELLRRKLEYQRAQELVPATEPPLSMEEFWRRREEQYATKQVNPEGAADIKRVTLVKREKQNLEDVRLRNLTEIHGLVFFHVRNYGTSGEKFQKGGITVAYRLPPKGCRVVELSTAICHDKETFNKFTGKLMAANNFNQGKAIKVKLSEPNFYTDRLREMFLIGL